MICDREDCCVFEMQDGKLIFPTREALDAQRPESDSGMELKL